MDKQILGRVRHFGVKNGPTILTAVGIAGFMSSMVLTALASRKAIDTLDNLKDSEVKEKAKALIPIYIPTVGVFLISAGAILAGHRMNSRRQAALAGLLSVAEKAIFEQREEITKMFGEATVKELHRRTDDVNNLPLVTHYDISKGFLFYDAMSGRYFTTISSEDIRSAVNQLSHNMLTDMTASVNDFYYLVGLPPIDVGNDIGWKVENGVIDVVMSSTMAPGDIPCVVVKLKPTYLWN